MSVWRTVQEMLYQRWDERWRDGLEPATPTFFENEPQDPPDGQWAKVSVRSLPGGPGTIGKPGNRKMDRAGVVFIDLREPPLDGVGNLSDRAEQARRVFENCRIRGAHDARFAQVDIGDESLVDNGRWWGVTVEARFDYEEVK